MLIIHCPLCGERPYTEYLYGGDADKLRPAHGANSRQDWYEYVFLFDNPKGPHREHWQHISGCRQWLVVLRDTAANTVMEVTLARDARGRGAAAPENP